MPATYPHHMPDRPRHVHIHHPDGTTAPGLLIDWQRRNSEWWANVAIVTGDGHLVVTWRHQSAVRAVLSD